MKKLIRFRCPACGEVLEREVAPTRTWIKSYCEKSDRFTHCFRSEFKTKKQRVAEWYQNNRERLKAKHKAALKAWRKSNPEKVRLQNSRRWKKHRVKMSERKKQWTIKNSDRVKAKTKAWQKANPDKLREYQRRNYLANRQRRYQNAYSWNRKQVRVIGDMYCKRQLRKEGVLNPTTKQIEQCRHKIQLHRSRQALRLTAAASQLSNLSTS